MNKKLSVCILLASITILSACGTKSKETTSNTPPVVINENITKYEILSPIEFDEAPTAIRNDGYVFKQKGFYGFMDSDLNVIIEPKYEKYMLASLFSQTPSDSGVKSQEVACFFKGDERVNHLNETCGIFGFIQKEYVFSYDISTSEIMITSLFPIGDDGYWDTSSSGNPVAYKLSEFLTVTNMKDLLKDYNGNFFLAAFPTVDDTTITGPLDNQSTQKFVVSQDLLTVRSKTTYDDATVLSNSFQRLYIGEGVQRLDIVNAVKLDGKWSTMDADGKLMSDFIYTNLEPRSEVNTYIEQNGLKGIINFDGELVLLGEFEDVSAPLNDKAFVKMDGKWVQIQIIK